MVKWLQEHPDAFGILPFLLWQENDDIIAANPINTYKPIKLSTAEAIAASLYILGDIDAAEDILSVFKWGHSFITLNKEWLDSYASCANSSEIVKVQTEIMREHQKLDKNE